LCLHRLTVNLPYLRFLNFKFSLILFSVYALLLISIEFFGGFLDG